MISNIIRQSFISLNIPFVDFDYEVEYDGEGFVTYKTKKKTLLGLFDKKNKMYLTKFISSIISEDFDSGSNISNVCSLIISNIDVSTIEIHSNIHYAYSDSAPHSCMLNAHNFVDFYNQNGVKAIITKDKNGNIRSRALLWKDVDIINNGGEESKCLLVDRVYGPDEYFIINYAKSKGYAYSKSGVVHLGCIYNLIISKKIENIKKSFVPYLDTLSYYDLKSKCLINDYEYVSTNGIPLTAKVQYGVLSLVDFKYGDYRKEATDTIARLRSKKMSRKKFSTREIIEESIKNELCLD